MLHYSVGYSAVRRGNRCHLDRRIVHQHAPQASSSTTRCDAMRRVSGLINQRLKKVTSSTMRSPRLFEDCSFLLRILQVRLALASFWQILFRAIRDVYKLPPLIRQKMHAPPTTTTTLTETATQFAL